MVVGSEQNGEFPNWHGNAILEAAEMLEERGLNGGVKSQQNKGLICGGQDKTRKNFI